MGSEDEYWKFAESEKHFNGIQAGIRNIASGWMLAAFGAIALLLRGDPNVNWLVAPSVLIGIVCSMATLGLLILWINDQLVYQRLLDCGFLAALKREYDDPFLPPIRLMMAYSAAGRGMSPWMTNFYTIPMWGFLAITAAATATRKGIGGARGGGDDEVSLVVLIALCAVQLCATAWVHRTRVKVGAGALAEALGDDLSFMLGGAPGARDRIAAAIAGRASPGMRGAETQDE